MAEFLTSPSLAQHGERIAHGFFTRRGGVSAGLYASLNMGRGSNDRPEDVAQNRDAARQALGGKRLVTPYQVHGRDVRVVDLDSDDASPPHADAIITAIPGLVVGVLTADCCPVLLADPGAGIVGAAHAGWRGLVAGVIEATISGMEQLGASRSDMIAVTGPSIARSSYEVGCDMRDDVLALRPCLHAYFTKAEKSGHYFFDLPGAAQACLVGAGVGACGEVSRDCYAEEQYFYSYRRATHRREPDYGRQLSAIMLHV